MVRRQAGLPSRSSCMSASYPSLRTKVVLITGGATGIGREIAAAFAAQGATVAVLDKDVDAIPAWASDFGNPHQALLCDVADVAALRDGIQEIAARLGSLDVLITNAADDERHDAQSVEQDVWRASMAVNIDHQFFAAQAAEPHLRAAGGGSIICLGSISWMNDTTEMVAYSTAKSAVHGLVRTLARLWGPSGIRVNALVPGWTMTERQLERWVDEEAERAIDAGQCLPGRVMPADIAAAALFLASDDAAMITRQSLVVDAGWT